MEKERFLKKKKKVSKIYHIIQCVLFFCILLCGCVVGFLMPLRPKVSDLEKRTLTEFPKFSKQGFFGRKLFERYGYLVCRYISI